MLTSFQDIFAPPRHLILLVIAAWAGLLLTERRAQRHGIETEQINGLAFYSIIGFVIGGRILFAIQNFSAFNKSPASLLAVNPDLFDLTGGLATAVMIGLIYGQRNQLPVWSLLDAFTPFFAALMIGVGFSHLASGTAFGMPTELPWGMELWNARRHPTQIYEIIASASTFALVWIRRPSPYRGVDFLFFTAITAGWHLFLSAFRADSTLVLNGFHREQVLALFTLAACFVLIEWRLTLPDTPQKNSLI